ENREMRRSSPVTCPRYRQILPIPRMRMLAADGRWPVAGKTVRGIPAESVAAESKIANVPARLHVGPQEFSAAVAGGDLRCGQREIAAPQNLLGLLCGQQLFDRDRDHVLARH